MRRENKKRLLIFLIIFIVLAGLFAAFLVLEDYFRVEKVEVIGAERYTEDEIRDMVMSGTLGDNSLFLRLKYRDKEIKDIPFVEKMDVKIEDPKSITINVYEKAIAGYVEYLGHYMYFDKDGIIVESSTRRIEGIPFVTGLKFDHCVMYEPLPIDNKDVFAEILSLTQLMEKYDIHTDRIYFDRNMEIMLFFGEARVFIGSFDNIDDKMIRLQYIIPKLKGMKGVLHMENYSQDSHNDYITFKTDE